MCTHVYRNKTISGIHKVSYACLLSLKYSSFSTAKPVCSVTRMMA